MSTIAAISTPLAPGGIGIIRISGEEAINIADRVFRAAGGKTLSALPGYRAAFGRVVGDGGAVVDECVALVFRAPKSYTGEDTVELSCHGGIYVVQKVLRLVLAAGAAPAEPGEFTKRAFLGGKIDLTEAEAVMGIISAQGEQALAASQNALEGTLSREISAVTSVLLSLAASLAVWADYPDEDIPEIENNSLKQSLETAREQLSRLIDKYDAGQAITAGVDTVICGQPNVGKSTVMNLLARAERSIVTEIAGTTRDIVEDTVRLGNVLLRLADTAGLRESGDPVENIGVERARQRMEHAGLLLAVFDSSNALSGEDLRLLEFAGNRRTVALVNKADLETKIDINHIKKYIPNVVEISAKTGSGLENLEQAIEEILGTNELDTSAAMLATERQLRCCTSALSGINEAILAIESGLTADAVNVSIDFAVSSLLELTGEKATDAVIDEVFKNFCVGK